MSAILNTYNRKKISFKKGKGSFLYSTNGKKYLDFVQGIAVNCLGHANDYLVKSINKQSKKFYRSKEAAHKKHYKIKSGQPIEGLDPESIKLCLYENNFTELFDNLGILGEYQLESANLFGAASDVVAKRRSKKYGDKIAAPDEGDTESYRDWEVKEIKSMSNWKGRKRLKKVEIKI